MKLNQTIKLFDLIDFLRTQKKASPYCIYGKGKSDQATLDDECVIDDYSKISDDDEEIFPDSITQKNLEFWFTDELLEDVLLNTLKQSPKATNSKILDAIKHYNKHDSFLKL